jgi:hypothetical protein
MLFATADHPLIGEDLFAGTAYVSGTPAHVGSLRAQDVVRLVIGGVVIVAVIVRTLTSLPGFLAGLAGF